MATSVFVKNSFFNGCVMSFLFACFCRFLLLTAEVGKLHKQVLPQTLWEPPPPPTPKSGEKHTKRG